MQFYELSYNLILRLWDWNSPFWLNGALFGNYNWTAVDLQHLTSQAGFVLPCAFFSATVSVGLMQFDLPTKEDETMFHIHDNYVAMQNLSKMH